MQCSARGHPAHGRREDMIHTRNEDLTSRVQRYATSLPPNISLFRPRLCLLAAVSAWQCVRDTVRPLHATTKGSLSISIKAAQMHTLRFRPCSPRSQPHTHALVTAVSRANLPPTQLLSCTATQHALLRRACAKRVVYVVVHVGSSTSAVQFSLLCICQRGKAHERSSIKYFHCSSA
jgi:hypothetical protein